MPFYLIRYFDQSGVTHFIKEGADDQTAAEIKAVQIVTALGGTVDRVANISYPPVPVRPAG